MFGSLLGGIVGGVLQNRAAKETAKISREALERQTAQQERVWSAADPYMKSGATALSNLQDPNAFMTSPGYQFRMGQGLEAVAGNKAVNGLLRSGGAMKALNDYGQGMASDEYGKWFGQQSSIAGMGLTGVGIGAGVANQNSANIGADATNRGNAALTGANAWAKIAGQVGGAFDRSSFGGS